MRRLLPPALVLLTLAAVAVRCAMEPSRAEGRERIAGMVQGGAWPEAAGLLETYLGRFHEVEDTWFASRMWFRMQRPVDAIDAVWNDAALAARPDTSRRFAETALFALGWTDEDRENPTSLEPHALVVLVEGGNAWAEARLAEHARTYELRETTPYLFPAVRGANRRPLELIIRSYRSREDKRFHVASAFASLGPEPYAERDADRDRLIGVIADETWRRQYADVWAVSAFALGRLGDAPSRAALAKAAAALEGSANERDVQDLLLTRVGEIAAGDFTHHDEVAQHVFGQAQPNLKVVIWYQEALIFRYQQGDARTEAWLRRMWEGPAAVYSDLRTRQARAFLLTDEPPSDEAQRVWVDRMLADLDAPGAPLVSRVMAAAARLRRGEPEARTALIGLLRQAASQGEEGRTLPPEVSPPIVEALRSLYLYG